MLHRAQNLDPHIDSLSALNDVQRDAVLHDEGALLLLAGAGSGKTRVVTTRIARLLSDGAPPSSIPPLPFRTSAGRPGNGRIRRTSTRQGIIDLFRITALDEALRSVVLRLRDSNGVDVLNASRIPPCLCNSYYVFGFVFRLHDGCACLCHKISFID